MAATGTSRAFGAELVANTAAASPAPGKTPAQLKAFSEKRLEGAFESICAQNTNKLGEWETRAKGLEALQELLSAGACESPHFLPLYMKMLEGPVLDMATRSRDSKPALVKVGCATIEQLAVALSGSREFAKTGEGYVLALLKNVRDGQTHGVIDDSQACMQTLLANIEHPKMVTPFLERCSVKDEKSPICRTASIEHLCFIVQSWPVNVLKKQIPAITEGIKKALADVTTHAITARCLCGVWVYF